MVKLIWTEQAINDLEDIGDYIAESSEKYAKLTVKRLYEKSDILKQFPQTGRVVPEKNEETVRELIEGNYRITGTNHKAYQTLPHSIPPHQTPTYNGRKPVAYHLSSDNTLLSKTEDYQCTCQQSQLCSII
jgi:toxin ParE1/3/4